MSRNKNLFISILFILISVILISISYNTLAQNNGSGTAPSASAGEGQVSGNADAPSDTSASEGTTADTQQAQTDTSQQQGEIQKVPDDAGVAEDSVVEEAERKVGNITRITKDVELNRFGYEYFEAARNRIRNMEAALAGESIEDTIEETEEGTETREESEEEETRVPRTRKPTEFLSTDVKDAISGFVGPVDMINSNVTATIPAKYVLSPGDKIMVSYWSDVIEIQTMELAVGPTGEVIIPQFGNLVARGMTLTQFQQTIKDILNQFYKNVTVIAQLESLRSIQISIAGEAFRPGGYAISNVTTLFNALYLCGGPSDYGSLRNIKLLRNGESKEVDFYKFLMNGDSSQDYTLNAGDTIFIAPIGKTAHVTGEVKRPAIYEMKDDENLLELLSLAGGMRPSGLLQRVRIDSVEPGKQRILVDVNLSDSEQENPVVFDGDIVTVFSIPMERMNTVTIEGKVRMPGIYQLKEGMTVSDLINVAQGLLGEAYLERADILRLNSDKTTTRLIPVNLSKALAGDIVDNVTLKQWDKLIIYSKWEVQWNGDRMVTVRGAVQNPDIYDRHDGMTVADLLMQAGGLLPEAYQERAWLMRMDENGEMTKSIPLNLKGYEKEVELKDGDLLIVYSIQEAIWRPAREVNIFGGIQNPGNYPRTDGMKIADLIHLAGGMLPSAYPERALLLRLDERQQVTNGIFIKPKLALRDDPSNNLELKDGDRLRIYTYQEARWEPYRKVTIVGAVHRPGDIPIINKPREVPDVTRQGEANLSTRIQEEEEEEEEEGPAVIALPDQVQGEGVESPFLTPQGRAGREQEEDTEPNMGSVFERTDGMRISDLIKRAGGLLPNAYLERADLKRFRSNYETFVTIPVNLRKAMSGNPAEDILLQDEDMLTVYTIREAQYKPDNIVIMYGAVQRPDIYTRTEGMRLSDLLFISGGVIPGALDYAEITRIDEEGKTKVINVDLNSISAGDESLDPVLHDEDVVSIRKDNEFLDTLPTVTIAGEVKYPGSYALKRNERLSDLIKRAGGLTDRAYPEASVITRSIDYLALEEQRKSVDQVRGLLENLSEQEYWREVAKGWLIEQRRVGETEVGEAVPQPSIPPIAGFGSVASDAISQIPEQTESAISGIEGITQPQLTMVTPARSIESYLPPGRLIVNLQDAINHPGKKDDIILENGDEIVVPPMLNIISVTGAVIQPGSYVYVESIKTRKPKDYIEMAGGFSRDADMEAVYVVKANGMVVREDKASLSPGDIIVVPTKIMVQKITDRWGQVITAVKFTVTTLALVVTIKLILDAVK
ncbi:hypothetical protein GF312_18730 [Candidatus Poribacteria bacterium]|nr:hypothetical protein [Candidatus Poribacteria bacterium]